MIIVLFVSLLQHIHFYLRAIDCLLCIVFCNNSFEIFAICDVSSRTFDITFVVHCYWTPTYIPSCKTEAYIPLESNNNASIVTCALVL